MSSSLTLLISHCISCDRMMSDYTVEPINDEINKFNVEFHGPKESNGPHVLCLIVFLTNNVSHFHQFNHIANCVIHYLYFTLGKSETFILQYLYFVLPSPFLYNDLLRLFLQ